MRNHVCLIMFCCVSFVSISGYSSPLEQAVERYINAQDGSHQREAARAEIVARIEAGETDPSALQRALEVADPELIALIGLNPDDGDSPTYWSPQPNIALTVPGAPRRALPSGPARALFQDGGSYGLPF